MDGIAIGMHRGAANGAVFVFYVMRFFSRKGASLHRLVECLIGISYFQRYVANTIAVLANMLGGRIIGRHRSGQEEVCLALTERVRGSLALSGFESAICDLGKAETFAIEEGRLARIADEKFNVVDTFELEWVLHALPPKIIFAHFSSQNNALIRWSTPALNPNAVSAYDGRSIVFHFTSIDTSSPSSFPTAR